MRRFCLHQSILTALLLGALAFAQTTGQPSLKAAPRNEILDALKTNHSVVVVVQLPVRTGSGEAYADWAEYLNDFAIREKSVRIVKLTPRRYSELVGAPKLSGSYNTLFLRDAENALLYRGMILEPEVYAIGKDYMTSKSWAQSTRSAGLEKVTLEIRH